MYEIVFGYSITIKTANVVALDHPAAAMISGNDNPSLWTADVEATRQLFGESLLVSIPGHLTIWQYRQEHLNITSQTPYLPKDIMES